jgi:hypothetical protein
MGFDHKNLLPCRESAVIFYEVPDVHTLLSLMYKLESNVLSILVCLFATGGVIFMPVLPASWLAQWGAAWQFPAFTIVLGSSYFQRLLVALPHLADAVRQLPSFAPYWPYMPAQNSKVSQGHHWCWDLHFSCL